MLFAVRGFDFHKGQFPSDAFQCAYLLHLFAASRDALRRFGLCRGPSSGGLVGGVGFGSSHSSPFLLITLLTFVPLSALFGTIIV